MTIYTDGACKENARLESGIAGGTGGWAYIVLTQRPGEDMEIMLEGAGQKKGTTNQEMEIESVSKAFESIKDIEVDSIDLYSDSAYVINCLKDRWFVKWRANGWKNSKGQPVRNQVTWERMISFVEKRNVNFFHVKRNSTKYIRIVDSMAKQASLGKIPTKDSECNSEKEAGNSTISNNLSFESL